MNELHKQQFNPRPRQVFWRFNLSFIIAYCSLSRGKSTISERKSSSRKYTSDTTLSVFAETSVQLPDRKLSRPTKSPFFNIFMFRSFYFSSPELLLRCRAIFPLIRKYTFLEYSFSLKRISSGPKRRSLSFGANFPKNSLEKFSLNSLRDSSTFRYISVKTSFFNELVHCPNTFYPSSLSSSFSQCRYSKYFLTRICSTLLFNTNKNHSIHHPFSLTMKLSNLSPFPPSQYYLP